MLPTLRTFCHWQSSIDPKSRTLPVPNREVDLRRVLLQAVRIELSVNAGRGALLRTDLSSPYLMHVERNRVTLRHGGGARPTSGDCVSGVKRRERPSPRREWRLVASNGS